MNGIIGNTLTCDQVSELTGIPAVTIRGMVRRKTIPHFRPAPHKVRFVEADIQKWLGSSDTKWSSKLMQAKDASKFLGVSSRTLQRWARDGKIPHRKVGNRKYFVQRDLWIFLETQTGEAATRREIDAVHKTMQRQQPPSVEVEDWERVDGKNDAPAEAPAEWSIVNEADLSALRERVKQLETSLVIVRIAQLIHERKMDFQETLDKIRDGRKFVLRTQVDDRGVLLLRIEEE